MRRPFVAGMTPPLLFCLSERSEESPHLRILCFCHSRTQLSGIHANFCFNRYYKRMSSLRSKIKIRALRMTEWYVIPKCLQTVIPERLQTVIPERLQTVIPECIYRGSRPFTFIFFCILE